MNGNPTSGTGRPRARKVDRRHVDRVPCHDLAVADNRCPIGEHHLPHPSARRRVRAVHCGRLRAEAVSSVSYGRVGATTEPDAEPSICCVVAAS